MKIVFACSIKKTEIVFFFILFKYLSKLKIFQIETRQHNFRKATPVIKLNSGFFFTKTLIFSFFFCYFYSKLFFAYTLCVPINKLY